MNEPLTEKKRPGRKRVWQEPTEYIGFKCPESVNTQLLQAVETLKAMGFDVDKSKLVRALVCYRISNATMVYKDYLRNG